MPLGITQPDAADTIAAIASPPGNAARGIIRISGDDVLSVLDRCVKISCMAAPAAFNDAARPQCFETSVQVAEPLRDVPCRLMLWPTSKSFTGQPVAELHLPGSPWILRAVLEAVLAAGARLAQPGEFSQRAFINGRIDLTQAEGIAGVVAASNHQQLQVALQQLSGRLRQQMQRLLDRLLELLAHLEAGLDFVEEDIEFISQQQTLHQLASTARELDTLLESFRRRSTNVSAIRVVIYGLPNVGKSSLFNALSGNIRALVADQAGTTRDYLTAVRRSDEMTFEFVDTAGKSDQDWVAAVAGAPNDTPDPATSIEARADQATERQLLVADVRLFCIDAARPLRPAEKSRLVELRHSDKDLVVITKCDRPADPATARFVSETAKRFFLTSSQTGSGIAQLLQAIAEDRRRHNDETQSTLVNATIDRSYDDFLAAKDAVDRAVAVAQRSGDEELVAFELRTAVDHLGSVIGTVYTDDLLDKIFRNFCIGK